MRQRRASRPTGAPEHTQTDRHARNDEQELRQRPQERIRHVHAHHKIQAVRDKGGDKVGYRTGKRSQRHAPASVPEIGDIDRHRTRPAEAEQQQAQETDRVDMRHRRQRYAAGITRGTITEQIGSTAVRGLVDGQAQHDRGQRKRQCDKCGADIAAHQSSPKQAVSSIIAVILILYYPIMDYYNTDSGCCHPNICSVQHSAGFCRFIAGRGAPKCPALHDNLPNG